MQTARKSVPGASWRFPGVQKQVNTVFLVGLPFIRVPDSLMRINNITEGLQ
jgi:hypothetical protein